MPTLSLILLVTFIFCLASAVAAGLLGRQLVTTYNTAVHRNLFYYLAAFYAFAFYGVWGQILARALLAAIDTDAVVVEAVAAFVPVLGVPFLFVSWIMLISLAHSLAGKTQSRPWIAWHAAVFVSLLLGSWLALPSFGGSAGLLDTRLSLVEAAFVTVAELAYFVVFLLVAWRLPERDSEARRSKLRIFASLLAGAFVTRSLFAGLVLIDLRLAGPALLVYFASNLGPLFYLRAISDAAFKPVKAEVATAKGIEHVLSQHGITKRERQVVEQICLGKTNKQIADELFISLQTVKDHTHRIYSKLGVKSRMQLVQAMDAAK
jgi:DNA-binding CsgD family transcriptional regulator